MMNLVNLLQTKFGVRCKVWKVASYNEDTSPCIRLRMEQSLKLPHSGQSKGGQIIDKKSVQK